jgi:hypothetical protein
MTKTCKKCGRFLKVKDFIVSRQLCLTCTAGKYFSKQLVKGSPSSNQTNYIKANFDALLEAELKRL